MLTVEPISLRGPMNPEKLKRYAKDSNVFVMYNTYNIISQMFEKINNPNCPSYEECYRVRPLSYFYNKATSSESSTALDSLCANIDCRRCVLFRIRYVDNHESCISHIVNTGKDKDYAENDSQKDTEK